MRLGSYEIDRVVGRGGMGVVFRARSADGRTVAIKLLARRNPESLARFERERRLLAELGEDQGFVPLLDAGTAPEGPFIVMPFLEGGTLRDRVARGPLPVDETLELARSLARALGAAHARGVVHRDVKPENVLYGERPLLADLGLAKHFVESSAPQSVSLSVDGAFRGTAGYMAPEQMADAKRAGPPADIYALGAILYECLAGEAPFVAPTVVELLARVAQGAFAPLAAKRREAPAWFAAVIERCLATDPARRFADGEALDRALAREGGGARPRALLLIAPLAVLALAGAVAGERLRERGPVPGVAPVASAEPPASKPAAPSDEDAVRRLVARAAKDPRAAVVDLSALTERRPDLASAWRALCELEVREHHPDRAVAAARRVVELQPRDASAHALLALADLALHTCGAAIMDANRALALDPASTDALALRSLADYWRSATDATLSDAEAVLAKAPGNGMAHFVKVRMLVNRQRLTDALAAADAAVASAPGEPLVWVARAAARAAVFETKGARADLDKALALDPRSAEPHLASLTLCTLDDTPDLAALEAKTAVELDPWDPFCWSEALRVCHGADRRKLLAGRRAFVLEHMDIEEFLGSVGSLMVAEDAADFVAVADQILARLPRNATALRFRGDALRDRHDLAGALESYDRAIQLLPADGSLSVRRASVLDEMGDQAAARREVERAFTLRTTPGDRVVLEKLRARLTAGGR